MKSVLALLKELQPEFDFENSENFIEDGYLDSFDLTTLISDLENEYNCMINPMDIRAENFISIDKIEGLIRKSGGDI